MFARAHFVFLLYLSTISILLDRLGTGADMIWREAWATSTTFASTRWLMEHGRAISSRLPRMPILPSTEAAMDEVSMSEVEFVVMYTPHLLC